jgi:hypothetical protein
MPKIIHKNFLFPESPIGLRCACNVCQSIFEIDESDSPKPVRFVSDKGEVGAYEIPCPDCPEKKLYAAALQDKELEENARDDNAIAFATFAGEQAHLGRIFR